MTNICEREDFMIVKIDLRGLRRNSVLLKEMAHSSSFVESGRVEVTRSYQRGTIYLNRINS